MYRNNLDEIAPLKEGRLFPLLKCTDVANDLPPTRLLIATQQKTGDETNDIRFSAPRTWAYLPKHLARFRARESSIYTNRPDFALFGIGPYAFLPCRVQGRDTSPADPGGAV